MNSNVQDKIVDLDADAGAEALAAGDELETHSVLLPGEAASYLRIAKASLSKMRCWGGGPEYLKFGRKIAYERAALDTWREQRRVRNTSDAAARVPRRMAEEPRGEAH